MTNNQLRVQAVLSKMMNMAKEDEDFADDFTSGLEDMLDDMAGNDAFGTERQCDPRGDGRNGEFSMGYVEGVDDA